MKEDYIEGLAEVFFTTLACIAIGVMLFLLGACSDSTAPKPPKAPAGWVCTPDSSICFPKPSKP